MKLIHCADLHLDSPMGTHMTMQQASARNTQIMDSFLRLTDFARENGVRAVIIAGDLFDGTRVRSRTVDEILAAMERTPEVDYLYLPGNHDGAARAFSDRVLPENLQKAGRDGVWLDHLLLRKHGNLRCAALRGQWGNHL